MKKHFILLAITLQSLLVFAQPTITEASGAPATDPTVVAPLGTRLQQLMDQYTAKGIPGIAIAVYNPTTGFWTGASGYANIENKIAMQPSHLQYGQSVAKTYTAVILLQMQEQGLINLDSPAAAYLPDWVNKKIPYTGEFTVRMLLNHSTGLPDYSSHPAYVIDLMQHPDKKFTIRDFVDYIVKEKRAFVPGTDYQYCNLNTELAALIADQISGDHAKYLQEHVFQKLSLRHSFYRTPGYLDVPELVSSYWDRFSDGIFENVSNMQRTNVGNMMGDDGIIATPLDYVYFLKGLFEEKLINKSSLDQMMTGVKGKDGQQHGGLGLFKFSMAGIDAYGHGGAGIGAGCLLIYIPVKQTYVFLGSNMGTLTQGAQSQNADNFKNELLQLILQ